MEDARSINPVTKPDSVAQGTFYEDESWLGGLEAQCMAMLEHYLAMVVEDVTGLP